MKQIAIPITDGKLSQYFGRCNHYMIFHIGEKRVTRRLLQVPVHTEISSMPLWISEQGITDVVTYKIEGRIMHLFAKYKINLYVGIKNESPKEIIQSYLNGKLKSDEKIILEIRNKYERG